MLTHWSFHIYEKVSREKSVKSVYYTVRLKDETSK